MRHGSLFSGIGGFDIPSEWAGWTNVFQVEWSEYCQMVLQKNFPYAKRFKDIREFDGTPFRGSVDVISGGFPCQPFSTAGNRRGKDDDRYLWPEMLRVIGEVQPTWIVGENVAGLESMDGGAVLEGILSDLENAGYWPEIYSIPSLSVGAPHRRQRLWIVAHSSLERAGSICEPIGDNRRRNTKDWPVTDANSRNSALPEQPQGGRIKGENANASGKGCGVTTDANGAGLSEPGYADKQKLSAQREIRVDDRFEQPVFPEHWYEVATRICGVDDGLPGGVDGVGSVPATPKAKAEGKRHRLEALGNAIVPQVAYHIFDAINQYNNEVGKD